MVSFLSKGLFFSSQTVKSPVAQTASSHVAQSVPSVISIIDTCVKKINLGKRYDQKRRWGKIRRPFHCGFVWDHFTFFTATETNSDRVPLQRYYNYIRSEFALIGTRHFLGTISRQRFWESNYSSRMSVPKTETASFRAIILDQSLVLVSVIPLWRRNSFSYKDFFNHSWKMFQKRLDSKKLRVSPR